MNARTFAPKKTLQQSEIDAELVLLDAEGGALLRLNEPARRLWRWIEEGRSIGWMADALVLEFAVDPAEAERDVRQFTSELIDLDLVEAGA